MGWMLWFDGLIEDFGLPGDAFNVCATLAGLLDGRAEVADLETRFGGSNERRYEGLGPVGQGGRGQVQHPNIVLVCARGIRLDGRSWFTMPEVVGWPLAAVFSSIHSVSRAGSMSTGWSREPLTRVHSLRIRPARSLYIGGTGGSHFTFTDRPL